MKTFPLTQFKLAYVAILFAFLKSCGGPTQPGSFKNDKISSGQRDDFHQLNTQVLKVLKADDVKGLNPFLSKEQIGTIPDKQVELISNRLVDNEYTLLDEYYVVHKYKDTDTVRAEGGDVKRYAVLYPYAAKEMYMAFFVPKKSDNAYLISLMYAKFDYGWKLVKMELGPYTIDGKTAPEYYAMAKDRYEKKQLQAATNDAALAMLCFKPSSLWQYPDDADAGKFYVKVRTEANMQLRFPIVLHQVATGPMLLRMYQVKNDDGGTYPIIYYMTHFDLKDTTEVKKENIQVRNAISKIMPGVIEDNKYVVYSAFNKQPTGYEAVDHFDMKIKGN